MNPMTRQDLLNVTEMAKNKIIERLVTKYDVQAAADSARDRILANLQTLHMENQALMRQSNASRDQSWRRISALEAQIATLQQEIRQMHQTLQSLQQVQASQETLSY
jgi:DNA anti-recombination protein RmuC